MSSNWREYQEEAAGFFRNLGLDAETDVRLKGVRTHHDIDVVLRSHHVGFDVLWLVECKHWQTAVSKLHVLALREIVSDTGADRGILLSESGFQSGALEAAALTNVRATSLASLQQTASEDILAMRLRELHDRAQFCKRRYWEIPRENRIQRGLRPEVGTIGYSGASVVELADELLIKALRGLYPFECDGLPAMSILGRRQPFTNSAEVLKELEPLIAELESRLE